jgi:hypothetical protein
LTPANEYINIMFRGSLHNKSIKLQESNFLTFDNELAIYFAAMAFSKLKSPLEWSTKIIDQIIKTGHHYYMNHDSIDLMDHLFYDSCIITLNSVLCSNSLFSKENLDNMITSFCKSEYAIFNFDNTYYFLLININYNFFIFNCYCSNPKGMLSSRGFSYLKSFKDSLEIGNFMFLMLFQAKSLLNEKTISMIMYNCKEILNVNKLNISEEISFSEINHFIKQIPISNVLNIININFLKISVFINEVRLILKPILLNVTINQYDTQYDDIF